MTTFSITGRIKRVSEIKEPKSGFKFRNVLVIKPDGTSIKLTAYNKFCVFFNLNAEGSYMSAFCKIRGKDVNGKIYNSIDISYVTSGFYDIKRIEYESDDLDVVVAMDDSIIRGSIYKEHEYIINKTRKIEIEI